MLHTPSPQQPPAVRPRSLRARAAAAILAAGLAAVPGAPPAPAQPAQVIEAIVLEGASRLSQEAFVHMLSLKAGETYDATRVRAEFRRLWERKLFDDISVETRPGDKGVVLIFHVVERPLLTSIEYTDVKVLSRTQIEDRLRERNTELRIGMPLDYAAIKKAEDLIRNALAEKGYLDARVSSELQEISAAGRALTFKMETGAKSRIRAIDFTGNQVFSDSKLRRVLKNTHEHSWWRFLKGGSTYHPLALDQDLESVRQLYLNQGYVDVDVKPVSVEVVEDKPHKKEHKSRKWLHLTIPLEEGRSYRVGQLKTEGNSVFGDTELLQRIPLLPGMVYSGSLMQAGSSAIEADYGERGYFYVSTSPRLTRNDDGTVDITLRVDEDQRYFVNRIEFVGNTTTRDKVLRREMPVSEEDIFDLKKFRIGMRRINQLGYFQLAQEPAIEPIEGESKVNITIHGQEQNRNEIQVGGGYSGVDGAFFTASYATRNFLGLGEILSTSIQAGGRSDRFNIAFEEPYFLGKPMTLGFSIFRRDIEYTDFTQTGQGISATLGRRIAYFQRVHMIYRLEDLEIQEDQSVTGDESTVTSSLIPVYSLNTINNPFRPSHGFEMRFSSEYAGGFLGGDNYFVKPILSTTAYLKALKKTFFALHGEAGWVQRFGDGLLPLSDRFYLGGEVRGPRVYETRSISPIGYRARDGTNDCVSKAPDPNDPDDDRFFVTRTTSVADFDAFGNPISTTVTSRLPFVDQCGGNKFFLAQLEYVIPVGQPMELALFFDAGNAFLDDAGFDFGDMRMSAGIEARLFLPVFQFPLRLIYGQLIDPREGEDASAFTFSIGRSF
jgi:outer membrane protein insertion porin family